MDEQYYRQLVDRFLSGKCTDEELAIFVHLMSEGKLDSFLIEATSEIEDQIEETSIAEPTGKNRLFPYWLRYTAVATIILTLFASVYFNQTHPDSKLTSNNVLTNDAMPGGNEAILALANGTKVSLGEIANGNIPNAGNTRIVKINSGKLIFKSNGQEERSAAPHPAMNTLSTPKGGQFQLELPDGTLAWINASSSVIFPTTFSGPQRKVKITGEVYFEVAKNPKKPFIVETDQQTVTVLGTHFNVSAYRDEQETKTTLLEGSVRVTSKYGTRILSPGQQSILSANNIAVEKTVKPTVCRSVEKRKLFV